MTPQQRLAAYEPAERGRVHVPDPEVMATAQRILALYIEERGKLTPGLVTVGKAAIPSFYKAAVLCRERKLEPEQYVRQILHGMSTTGQYWPSAVASVKLLDAAAKVGSSSIDLGRYKASLAAWSALSKTLGPEMAIRDPQSPFSPLFRMLLALEYDLPDVAAEQREPALFELRSCEIARDVFAELLERHGVN